MGHVDSMNAIMGEKFNTLDGLNEMQLTELNVWRVINELTAAVMAYGLVGQKSS